MMFVLDDNKTKLLSALSLVILVSLISNHTLFLFTAISNTENNSHSVQAFPPTTYQFVKKWGSAGSADGQFLIPAGLAVDSSRNLYVADRGNNRIQVFAPSSTTNN